MNIDPTFPKQSALFALLGLLIGFLYVLFKYRIQQVKLSERKKADLSLKVSRLEWQALKAHLNPHFIFNSLNSVQSLIASGHKAAALKYLNKFSKLFRAILENFAKPKINLEEELVILRNYIELEELRYAQQFDFSITVDPHLRNRNILIPNLFLQPFVENAILNSMLTTNLKGRIDIKITSVENILQFEFIDNGVEKKIGTTTNKNYSRAHKSAGMQISWEHVNLLNNAIIQEPVKIIDLYDQGIPSGTKVVIQFPYSYD